MRNPPTFVNILDARPEDFRIATEQVFHRKDAESGVEVLVLPQSGARAGWSRAFAIREGTVLF